ncbi:hypothetical protein C8F01DRAFT_1210043 [Mycena amicta]|nr:hypothetical protein C8F01DRAFT_1210043 [Mycena amicta]
MATIVFLGAPPASELNRSPSDYEWRTASSSSLKPAPAPHSVYFTQLDASVPAYPPATIEAVSRRISLMYQNVIFNDADDEDEKPETFITWPPTAAPEAEDSQIQSQSQSGEAMGIPSFLNVSKSVGGAATQAPFESQFETQLEETQSFNYSGGQSIARFPEFHFSLNALTPLSALTKAPKGNNTKVTMLLAVLEVDGPDTFRFKKGKDAGKESFVLKMILGDEEGNVCKLTAWREVAQDWGGCGLGADIGVKRGDVLLLTDVMAAYEPATAVALTASPWHKPKLEICYRTMPYTHEDQRLRPDLRLGASDASVRKVAAVVRWFEGMAGLAAQ